jgi:hypothetical protein
MDMSIAALADIGVARKFNPRNINPMLAVKFSVRLDLDPINRGHQMVPVHFWTDTS